jgi:hypothetical protein
MVLILLITAINIYAQFRTQMFQSTIKTLEVGVDGQKYLLPIISLNGDERIRISFDEMSHEAHTYNFSVIHCNADWKPSSLNSSEYIDGFTTGEIADFQLSVNTTFLYTHYNLVLPNDDMRFKVSGNYVLFVYEDNVKDKPVFQACFSVIDPHVSIDARLRGNTDTELSGRLQQIDFDVDLNGYVVKDVATEVKVVVRQNNRFDNEVRDLSPTYFSNSKLSYINNKSLIFEGGNEFHSFDISSVYAASRGVDKTVYAQPHYDVYLTEDKVQTSKTYMPEQDVNGKFLINHQESFEDSDNEGDYMWVHFMLKSKPFFDGLLYLGGELNYNLLNSDTMMKYDFDNEIYYKSLLLKQGGYNYQYRFIPKGQSKAIVERVEGSYWQTDNEYTIYIYHRPWGERYDHLIAVKQIQ